MLNKIKEQLGGTAKHTKYFLKSIFPTYWFMNYGYNKDWDRELKILMRDNKFIAIDRFKAKLGDVDIWIKNYPYACFIKDNYQYVNPRTPRRPSRITIAKAYDKLINDLS